MMLRLSLAASLCGLLILCGCNAPGTVSRGQSPDSGLVFSPSGELVSSGPAGGAAPMMGGQPMAMGAMSSYPMSGGPVYYDGDFPSERQMMREQKQDARFVSRGILPPQGSPYRDVSMRYHTLNDGQQGCPTGNCPNGTCQPGGCPTGQCGNRGCGVCKHGYPVDGTDFWPGGCPFCGADYVHCAPHHYHSFSYRMPRNLTYPSSSAIGGAVVYPYYTHKGPSDFFRQ